VGCALVLVSETVAAGSAQAAPERADPRMRHGADCQLCFQGASGLELAVPLWVPFVGLEGQSTADDGSTEFATLDTQLQFAIVAEARLRFGPVGVALSANGVSLGAPVVQNETGEVLGEVNLDAYFGRLELNWYTPPYRLGLGKRPPLLAIWPYMGARYAVLSGSGLNADETLTLEGEYSWGEPLFGVEFLLDLRRGWLFRLKGDVGGFTLGSEISVWGSAELQYAVANWLNFHVGWILYGARLEVDGVRAEFTLQGPAVGFGLPLF
jgi:hypothetical protein